MSKNAQPSDALICREQRFYSLARHLVVHLAPLAVVVCARSGGS
jgi:hypothetical protein